MTTQLTGGIRDPIPAFVAINTSFCLARRTGRIVFTECRSEGRYPQIWVSSSPLAALFDTAADRLRYDKENPRVKRFGELLSYATERFPVAGQQALITSTGALWQHFATGQQEGEEEHLGTLLVWIEPPAGGNILAELAAAELVPMGAKTDPTFDRQTLEPLVRAYNKAQRENAASKVLAQRAKAVHDVLVGVVGPIYNATQRAIQLLSRLNLPRLTRLASLDQRESDEFENFMKSRGAGYHLPLRDSPKSAAFKLAGREDALGNLETAVVHEDRVGHARARMAGAVLRGRVQNPRKLHVGPWRFEYVRSSPVVEIITRSMHGAVIETRERTTALSSGDHTGNQSAYRRSNGCVDPRARSNSLTRQVGAVKRRRSGVAYEQPVASRLLIVAIHQHISLAGRYSNRENIA